jgi:hypothetical protein
VGPGAKGDQLMTEAWIPVAEPAPHPEAGVIRVSVATTP